MAPFRDLLHLRRHVEGRRGRVVQPVRAPQRLLDEEHRPGTRDLVGRRRAGGLQIERDRTDVVDTQLGQRPSEDHDIHTDHSHTDQSAPHEPNEARSGRVAGEAVEDVGLGDEQLVETPVAHDADDDDRAADDDVDPARLEPGIVPPLALRLGRERPEDLLGGGSASAGSGG